jgi:hypothetical protein
METGKSLLWKDHSFVSCDEIINTKHNVHRSVLMVNKLAAFLSSSGGFFHSVSRRSCKNGLVQLPTHFEN